MQSDPIVVRHKRHIIAFAQQIGCAGQVVRVPHVVGIEQGDPIASGSFDPDVARGCGIASIGPQQLHRYATLFNLFN